MNQSREAHHPARALHSPEGAMASKAINVGAELGLGPPTSQHTNLPPLVEGPAIRLARRHAKVRRAGYRR
jgi:hypothetical protein